MQGYHNCCHSVDFAGKYADPKVALFYNDYETALEWKRDLIIKEILIPLKEKGLVDGMGMQIPQRNPCTN